MKYIIDIPDKYTHLYLANERGDTALLKPLKPYTEPDRKAIEDAQEEAWEFAKQVTIMTPDDKCELWGTSKYNAINLGYSYAEAKAKYEAWKKKKDEIHVGDEVEYFCGENIRFVVCGIDNGVAYGFKYRPDFEDLDIGEYCEIDELKKTGRHFDEVAELLKKMGGEEQ